MTTLEAPARTLSPREHEIAGLVREGLSNDEIAARLCISSNTVKTHVHRIMARLGVPSRISVAVLYPTLALPVDGRSWVEPRFVAEPEPTPATPAPTPPSGRILTEAERRVLGLLRRGLTNREIADALGRAHVTVKKHVESLVDKTGARHRAHLVVMDLPERVSLAPDAYCPMCGHPLA